MVSGIFSQVSLVLGVTTIVAWIAKLLRQPLLIAYIVAGVLSGPFVFRIFAGDMELYHVFSEFGVVFLLFVVGLELNFAYLKVISKVATFTGLFQMVFTASVGWFLLRLFGLNTWSALYIAVASVFSSTIIITKLLSDKKQTDSVYGRYTIGLMLVQDILAIIIMIGLSVFEIGVGQQALVRAVGALVGKGLLMAAFVVVCARFVLPMILKRIAHSSEFLFLFTITWCLGATSLSKYLGFSIEMGALMGGLALGSSPFQAEIMSRIKPLRDFFLILFFILLGSGLQLGNVARQLEYAVLFSLFILLGNPIILYIAFRLMKFTRRNSLFAGLTAAQVSEFGFVLLYAGERLGIVGAQEVSFFTIVALTTIFGSSYMVTYNEKIYDVLKPFFALFKKDAYRQDELKKPSYDVIVIGAHRIGWRLCHALKEKKSNFAVIDFNPDLIAALRSEGIAAYFGDVSDVEFLSELPLDKAKLIISTIPDAHDQITLINYVRSHSSKIYIVANLTHAKFRDALYHAGADYVMLPHVLGGELVADLIKRQSLTKRVFNELRKEQDRELEMGFIG